MEKVRTILIASLFLGTFTSLAAQPADPDKPVNDILQGIKDRAANQKRDDQRRALLLLQQSQTAHQAGRLAEAVSLAQKAQQLFPESDEIKQAYRNLSALQKQKQEVDVNRNVAKVRLGEALQHAAQLVRDRRPNEARELAEAVLRAAMLFPPDMDVKPERAAADSLLRQMNEGDTVAEVDPQGRTRRSTVDANLTPTQIRQALAVRLDVDWQDLPVGEALKELAQATGVKFSIDPVLERVRVPLVRRVDIKATNAAGERLLRMLIDNSGMEYVFVGDGIYLTSKGRALDNSIRTSRDVNLPPAILADPKPSKEPAAWPLLPAPKGAPYLQSGKAFLDHITSLLQPGNVDDRRESPLPPE